MAVNPRAVIIIAYRPTGNGIELLGISHDILEPARLEEVGQDWLRMPAVVTVFALTHVQRGLIVNQTTNLKEAVEYLQS